jgi:hypothetical protein
MGIFLKDLVHPSRVNAVVGSDVTLDLPAPVPEPHVYSLIERKFDITSGGLPITGMPITKDKGDSIQN